MSLLEDHYRSVREWPEYDDVDRSIGWLSPRASRHRFVFTDDRRSLTEATPADTLVSVGISMTGAPHVGTLGQIRSTIRLQQVGFDVQLVLADLVVYNGRGADLPSVQRLARHYRAFALAVGFDADRGSILLQSEAQDYHTTAFRLARHYDPSMQGAETDHEPTALQDALSAAYEAADVSSTATAFSQDLVGLLLAADTLHPLLADGYDRVVLCLGADNVGLADRIETVRAASGIGGDVVGLYTRLVAGRNGVPKMAKSIHGSSIDLSMAPDRVRMLVHAIGLDDRRSRRRAVHGMMRLVSPYSGAELTELAADCVHATAGWSDAVTEYAEYLASCARTWRATAP